MIDHLFPTGDIRRPDHLLMLVSEFAHLMRRQQIHVKSHANLGFNVTGDRYTVAMTYMLDPALDNGIPVDATIELAWPAQFEASLMAMQSGKAAILPDAPKNARPRESLVFNYKCERPMDPDWRIDDVPMIGQRYLDLITAAFPAEHTPQPWAIVLPVYYSPSLRGLEYLCASCTTYVDMEDLSDDTRRQEALTGIVTEIRAVMRVFAEEQRLPSQDLPYENINFNNG